MPPQEDRHHTDKQQKVEVALGGKTASHSTQMLLLPATPINKLYNLKHEESDENCTSTVYNKTTDNNGHSCS